MSKPQKNAASRRTSPPRPDQLTDETVEFLAALDLYKREQMQSPLPFEEVFPVLEGLGYTFVGERKVLKAAFDEALAAWREESDRLFPCWSEVFGVAIELGWTR